MSYRESIEKDGRQVGYNPTTSLANVRVHTLRRRLRPLSRIQIVSVRSRHFRLEELNEDSDSFV